MWLNVQHEPLQASTPFLKAQATAQDAERGVVHLCGIGPSVYETKEGVSRPELEFSEVQAQGELIYLH